MADDQIPDDVMEMLPEFLQESDEHLQVLNEKMLQAETAVKGGAAMSPTDLNTMFRSAHTIKGTASFIGLKKVVALTHKAETLLQKLRDGEMALTEISINALFSAIDTLGKLMASLKESKTESVAIEADVQKIEAILNPGGAGVNPASGSGGSVPVPAAAPPPPPPPPSKPAPVVTAPRVAPQKAAESDSEPINEKYLEQFVSEVEGNVEQIDELFVKAEQEAGNSTIVNEIFRHMHTIKGSAGLVNAKLIADVAHKMENILHFFRSQDKPLPKEMLPILFKGVDALRGMIKSLRETRSINFDIVPICKELDKASIKVVLEQKVAQKMAGSPSSAAQSATLLPASPVGPKVEEQSVEWSTLLKSDQKKNIADLVQSGQDLFLIEAVIAARETIKSMRLVMIEGRLAKNGQLIAAQPSGAALDLVKTDALVSALFCSNINETNIREILTMDGLSIRTVEKADQEYVNSLTEGITMSHDTPQTPVPAPASGPTPAAASAPAAPTPAAVTAPSGGSAAAGSNTPIEISTIKIDSRKLDKLMNLSGELVIIRSQYARLVGLFNSDLVRQKEFMRSAERSSSLLEDFGKEFAATSGAGNRDSGRIQKLAAELKVSLHALCAQLDQDDLITNIHTLAETTGALEKVASDLQAGVMQTRMVPVEGVFTRFKRIVRDIAKDVNKEVNLKIEGAETELDKKIVDGLGDPLTHMIRNAVDHGLEDADARAKSGKPMIGTILLRASHKGNSMCIEVGDDGKGMDPDKIAAVAIKKGVISEDQATRMTDKEKLNLIFLPGFSTAQKVTGLSGRGVGMDVVRSMITSFNGVVDIDTRVGEGSTFVLRIPLTLAIIQALLVVIGGEVYAFPLDAVTEIIKVPPKDIYSIDGNATVKLRDHALSLIELEKVISVKPNKPLEQDEDKRVIIITDGENRLGVLVDALLGKDEIVIKSFTKHFSRVRGIIGASILADGNVALILDPATIIKESR